MCSTLLLCVLFVSSTLLSVAAHQSHAKPQHHMHRDRYVQQLQSTSSSKSLATPTPVPIATLDSTLSCNIKAPVLVSLQTWTTVNTSQLNLTETSHINYTILYEFERSSIVNSVRVDVALFNGDWLNTLEPIIDIDPIPIACTNISCQYIINQRVQVGTLIGRWIIRGVSVTDESWNTAQVGTNVTLFEIVDSGVYIESSLHHYSHYLSHPFISSLDDLYLTVNLTTITQTALTNIWLNYGNNEYWYGSIFLTLTSECCEQTNINIYTQQQSMMIMSNWTITTRLPGRNIIRPGNWSLFEITLVEHKVGRFHDYFSQDMRRLNYTSQDTTMELLGNISSLRSPTLLSITFNQSEVNVSPSQSQLVLLNLTFSDAVIFETLEIWVQSDHEPFEQYPSVSGTNYIEPGVYQFPFIIAPSTQTRLLRITKVMATIQTREMFEIKITIPEADQPTLHILNGECTGSTTAHHLATWEIALIGAGSGCVVLLGIVYCLNLHCRKSRHTAGLETSALLADRN